MKKLAPLLMLLCVTPHSSAQDLEPGAYSVSPYGVNFLVISNNLSGGDVTFDPTLPIEDASATINTTVVAYVRTVRLFGRSAQVGAAVPYSIGHIEGLYLGQFTNVDRSGFRDLQFRFALNLYGAPAMSLKEFASYRQKTNVGVSLAVVAPLGEYDPERLINLGSSRWAFKPEIGLSRAMGSWTLELYGNVWLFTDNDDFFGGRTREQDPIGAFQAHLVYIFKPRMWVALDANYYYGGRTTVDGTENFDLQKNSRVGVTFAVPVNPRQSLKFALSRGAYTSVGADFTAFVAGFQYLWGGGL